MGDGQCGGPAPGCQKFVCGFTAKQGGEGPGVGNGEVARTPKCDLHGQTWKRCLGEASSPR